MKQCFAFTHLEFFKILDLMEPNLYLESMRSSRPNLSHESQDLYVQTAFIRLEGCEAKN